MHRFLILFLLASASLLRAENRAVLFDYPAAAASNIVFRVYWSTNALAASSDWIQLTNFPATRNRVFSSGGMATYRVVFDLTVAGTNYLRGTASDANGESDPSVTAGILVLEGPPVPIKPAPPFNFRQETSLLRRGPMFASYRP